MRKKRGKKGTVISSSELSIPSSIFQDRELSVLEAISEYLKEEKNMRYSEIAKLLNRDDRTIWTAYQRAKRKRSLSEISDKSETKKKRNT